METLGLDPEVKAAESETPAAEVAEETPAVETELEKAEKAVVLAQAKVESLKNPGSQILNKAEIVSELKKASDDKFKAIATILRSKDDKIETLEKSIGELVNFNKVLGERLGIVEKTPMQPKAIRGKIEIQERFAKGGDGGEEIEKGEVPTYSMSNHKHRGKVAGMILTEVGKSWNGDKLEGDNLKLQKSISQVEIGNISDPSRDLIQERLKIRLVR